MMLHKTLALIVISLLAAFWSVCAQSSGRERLAAVVPVLVQPFTDMNIMLEGAEIVRQQGFAQFWETVDEKKLDYNYPRTWAALGVLGVGSDELKWTALLALLALLAATWQILGLLDKVGGYRNLIVLPLFLSPAVFLAVERANTDLFIFGGVGLMLLLVTCRQGALREWVVLGIFLLLILLKVYPVLLFPVLWPMMGGSLAQRRALVIGVVLCLAWLVPDLIQVATRTHQGGPASYGVTVLKLYIRGGGSNFLGALLGYQADFRTLSQIVGILSYTVALGCLFFNSWIVRKIGGTKTSTKPVDVSDPLDRCWLAGSLIYVGTFLLGANFDYRLIFLLFTVPWYLWHQGKLSWIYFALLLISMWAWYLPRDEFPVRLIAFGAQWLLYIEVVCLLFVRCFRPFGEQAIQFMRARAY